MPRSAESWKRSALRFATPMTGWDITVPTRRVDVTREVDLIEEVARHCGFDRIPVDVSSADGRAAAGRSAHHARPGSFARSRPGKGFSEAVTFGFTSAPAAEAFVTGETIVPIKNPLSEAFAVLRPSLLPGTRGVGWAKHPARSARRAALRDRQSLHAAERRDPGDRVHLDRRRPAAALERADARSRLLRRDEPRVDGRGDLDATGALPAADRSPVVPGRRDKRPKSWPAPGIHRLAGALPVGLVGRLTPGVGELLGLPAEVPAYVAELAIEPLARFRRTSLKASAPPRFPSVDRDISILVDDTTPAQSVRETVRSLASRISPAFASSIATPAKAFPRAK